MSLPTYRVSTVVQYPFMMEKNGGGFEGFIVDLLDNIANQKRFQYTLLESTDGRYGGREQNGRWFSMIGDLINNTITSEREAVVDFTAPYMNQGVRLLVKRPISPVPSLRFLLEPFSNEVWVFTLVALVIVVILFMLIGRFNPYEWRQVPSDKDPRGARHSFGLRESLMFVFSTATLQGYRETPRSVSGRVLTISWFIFVFIIIVAFLGNFITYILIGAGDHSPTMPFENYKDLTERYEIQVGAVGNGTTFRTLRSSSVDTYKRLADIIESSNSFVKNYKRGVERVRNSGGQFVLLMDSSVGDATVEKDCSLMMYGDSLFASGLGFATRKGSPLLDVVSSAILSLKESGDTERLRNKWWKRGNCARPQIAKRRDSVFSGSSMTMNRLVVPFLTLLAGAILSVLIVIGEILYKKVKQKE